MKNVLRILLAAMLALALLIPTALAADSTGPRARMIVTTDLECDDMASFIHLLLYANDIDIEGIVVSSSTHHWIGDGEHTMGEVIESIQKNGDLTIWRPMELDWVSNLIRNEYTKAYPNLLANDPNYPSPGELLEITKIGNVEFEGDYRFETDGSRLIQERLLADDERPIYLTAWGGTNTIARALLSIEEEYKDSADWQSVYDAVCSKTVLISWGDQDNSYIDYIAVNWPGIKRMYCLTSGVGYGSSLNVTVPYRDYFKAAWLTENIKFNHGELLGAFPLFGDGIVYKGETDDSQFGNMATLARDDCWLTRFMGAAFERYDWISEGDSPCWMYLIPTGLRGLEDSVYGSWGGRMGLDEASGTYKAIEEFDPTTGASSRGYSLWRWLPAFMNDFAVRADWCVAGFEENNHQPVVTAEVLDYSVTAGETVELLGSADDPDGDALHYDWFVYSEASDYEGAAKPYLDVWAHDVAETRFTVPTDAQVGDMFNLVLAVTDDGNVPLTRYAQVIVTVIEAQ